jgi:hypothetical protein
VIQRESPGLVFSPNGACRVQLQLFVRIVVTGTQLLLFWNLLLIFHISQASDFLRNRRVFFKWLSQKLEFFSCCFCRTRHRWRPLLDPWFVLNVSSWSWDLCLILAKSLFNRLELWSSSWIYLHDDAVTVWNGFYVGLDDTFTDVILTRACLYDRFLVKKSFSQSCGVKRGSMVSFWIVVFIEILTRTCWIDEFWDLIDFSLRLKNESHPF